MFYFILLKYYICILHLYGHFYAVNVEFYTYSCLINWTLHHMAISVYFVVLFVPGAAWKVPALRRIYLRNHMIVVPWSRRWNIHTSASVHHMEVNSNNLGQAITPYECYQTFGLCSMMLTTEWPMMTDWSHRVWNLAESSGAFLNTLRWLPNDPGLQVMAGADMY